MDDWLERSRRIYKNEGIERLQNAHVIVFGLGGVGGHACEALARAGVGHLTLVDGDEVSLTNLNRQLAATLPFLGRPKTEALRDRLLAAAPGITIDIRTEFLTEENAGTFFEEKTDYVLDCIDQVPCKVAIAREAERHGIPVIAAMGAGNKIHPELFEVADIEKTSVCPLARVMRRKYREAGIKGVKVVYSREEPLSDGQSVPGSTSFAPGVMGMIMASRAINEIAAGAKG